MGKIKVGFVGAGWMGSCQMQRITDCNDTEIVALFEKNMGHGKCFKGFFNTTKVQPEDPIAQKRQKDGYP
jgi:predicted homoserine dehydrogenase-like protein